MHSRLKAKGQGKTLAFYLFIKLEAPIRFELMVEVLQTSALPLGDGAPNHFVKPDLNTKWI